MGEVMKIANFAFVEAKFAAGDFNSDIIQNVGRASRRLKARKENVAGVSLPAFEVRFFWNLSLIKSLSVLATELILTN